MFLMDVNVLAYAHREDVENHIRYRRWKDLDVSKICGSSTPSICPQMRKQILEDASGRKTGYPTRGRPVKKPAAVAETE
ncbi:MAG: hypothetical protein JXR78_18880 [Victivallales bacterium]|nr:hypothetical protein [Victivallales bacterium]